MESPNDSNSLLPSHPPQPCHSSFSSLPDSIVLSILARISASYYPQISLVSKSFCSHILSKELYKARLQLGTLESCVYVCLLSPTHPSEHKWFSLWIKPDDHQTLTHCTSKDKSTGNLLVPMPSFYSPCLPVHHNIVGSETYRIGEPNTPSFSTDVWVRNDLIGEWCKAPCMMVARKNAITVSWNRKIYVMGGCEADEPYWGEVFDTETQTWEPLPDPGNELRFSVIKNLEAYLGNILVRTNKKNFVYLIDENMWDVSKENLPESQCVIEDVDYCYNNRNQCFWFDTNCDNWRLVQGLNEPGQHFRGDTEIGNYGGKLVIFWNRVVYPILETREIWCAVVLLEKRDDGEVWGQIEWEDIVLKVPQSCIVQKHIVDLL